MLTNQMLNAHQPNSDRTIETALMRVEALCQARLEYNRCKLKQTTASALDHLDQQKIKKLQDPLNYAIKQYLSQIVLIRRPSDDLQTIIDQLYVDCFSYQKLEEITSEKPSSSKTQANPLLLSNAPSWICDLLDPSFESPFLEEIKILLEPLISPAMTRFMNDHTLRFKAVEGAALNVQIPLWGSNTEKSFLEQELKTLFSAFLQEEAFNPNSQTNQILALISSVDQKQQISMCDILDAILENNQLNVTHFVNRFDQLSQKKDLHIAIEKRDFMGYCKAYKTLYADFLKLEEDIGLYKSRCQTFHQFLKAIQDGKPRITSASDVCTPPLTQASEQRDHTPLAQQPSTTSSYITSAASAASAASNVQDIQEKIRLYRKKVEEERHIRSLELSLKRDKLKKIQENRTKFQKAQKELSEATQSQQRLEAAFVRLSSLNPHSLTLLQQIVGIPRNDGSAPNTIPDPNIPYRDLEALFKPPVGSLTSSARSGSHRKIILPALAQCSSTSEEQSIPMETLGFFDYTPSPKAEVKGGALRPHGSSHTTTLSPMALESIRSTLKRAGIDALSLQAFLQAKASPSQTSAALMLFAHAQGNTENTSRKGMVSKPKKK